MSLRNVVQEFLEEQSWTYEDLEEHQAFRFGFTTEQASYPCYAQIDEEREQCVVYTCLPNHVEETRRRDAAEFIARANYGMRIGNFEIDMEDGEVRFKASLDIEGGELTSTMLRNMIGASVTCTDRYYPGLMAMLFGGQTARQAVTHVETLSSIPDEI